MSAPKDELRAIWRHEETCVAKGVTDGGGGKGPGMSLGGGPAPSSKFYGLSNGPTHTFDSARFERLKGQGISPREAMAMAHVSGRMP